MLSESEPSEDDQDDSEAGDMDVDVQPEGSNSSNPNTENEAPKYTVPPRVIGAVEVPARVMNLDRAQKALGRVAPNWIQLLDPKADSIPLYLNPDNPFRRPINSHNATTHNVLLKVTIPKRTGRRRKRGTDSPWEGEVAMTDADAPLQYGTKVCSLAKLDEPRLLRRKMQDNVGNYHVEAVGTINSTHRFRGTLFPDAPPYHRMLMRS